MARKTDAKRSGKRSKSTALATGKALLTEIPGLNVPVALLERLVEHAADVRVERRDRRIRDLHTMLLSGRPAAEASAIVRELMDEDGPRETYESLLFSVVADEEDEKVPYYATMLRVLAVERTIETAYRRHLIKALRALTAADLGLLFRLVEEGRHVRKQFGEGVDETTEVALSIEHLIETRHPQTTISLQALVTHGFLRLPFNAGAVSRSAHTLTVFAQILVQILES